MGQSPPEAPPESDRFKTSEAPPPAAALRDPVPRPSGIHVYSYACPRCDILLCDGVAYETCPACDAKVDWVDLRAPIFACPTCDAMVNAARAEVPQCAQCQRAMKQIHVTERPPPPRQVNTSLPFTEWLRRASETPLGVALLMFACMVPSLSFALDERWRWLGIAQMLPAVAAPLIIAALFVSQLGELFRELRDLAKNRATRVIHGIEHATVVELMNSGVAVQSGLTEEGHFKVWVQGEAGEAQKRLRDGGVKNVREACARAIRKVRTERWSLAINRRCGTTWLTLFMLASVLALAAGALGLFFTVEAKTLLVIAGGAVALLTLGARPIGWLLQRLFTVDVDFTDARVVRVTRSVEEKGVSCYYVYLAVDLAPAVR